MSTLSDAQARVLDFLLRRGPSSPTEIGSNTHAAGRASRRQSWCRSAGRTLHALRRRLFVDMRCKRQVYHGKRGPVTHVRHEWFITQAGRAALGKLKEEDHADE